LYILVDSYTIYTISHTFYLISIKISILLVVDYLLTPTLFLTVGVDYTAIASETVTFSPGETCVSVVVNVTDDVVHEKNETFVGSLKTSNSTPGNILVRDPSLAVGTIINDDDLSKIIVQKKLLSVCPSLVMYVSCLLQSYGYNKFSLCSFSCQIVEWC